MRTKVLLSLVAFSLSASLLFGQSIAPAKITRKNFGSYKELRASQERSGIDTLTYVDSTFNYQVQIPNWLQLREASSAAVIGGTLPPINGIENVILITGFSKSEFKSFEEFERIYLTGNKFGEPARYNKEHIWYGQNELIKIDNGVKQKVYTFWNNKIYHSLFILIETKSAYLWIQFTSTPETYNQNISKLDEFMAGFKILN